MEALVVLFVIVVGFAFILGGTKGPAALLGCLFAPFKSCLRSLAFGFLALVLLLSVGSSLLRQVMPISHGPQPSPTKPKPAPAAPEPTRFDYPVGDDRPDGRRNGLGWYVSQDFEDRSENAYKPPRLHCGEDWCRRSGCVGSSVYAIAEGTVLAATSDKSYGHYVIIRHLIQSSADAQYVTSFYGHLGAQGLTPAVGADGQPKRVQRGDPVGQIGARGENGVDKQGNSWPPHMHFEVREAGAGGKDTYISVGYYDAVPYGFLNPTDVTSPGNSAQAGNGWIDAHR